MGRALFSCDHPRYHRRAIPGLEKQWNILEGRKIPLWLTCFIVLGTAYSFYHNTDKGGYKTLRYRYDHRLNASFDFLQKNPGSVVVLSHQAMSYDFAYLFDKNYFFAAPGDDGIAACCHYSKSMASINISICSIRASLRCQRCWRIRRQVICGTMSQKNLTLKMNSNVRFILSNNK